MTGRRKGTPCACETDPCSCGSSKGKCIRAINNVSPDPNGDFNIKAGAGIAIVQSNDDEITVINTSDPDAFLAGDNIEIIDNGDGTRTVRLADVINHNGDISQTGDLSMTGDLSVNGNIVQNGAYYDTHAEHIYTADDYIIMRDGAIAALSAGDYSGFQVKLYDGVNDGRLVIDNSGTARVGDVGDEQPLMTRDEAADLTDGDSLIWDAANSKAVTAAIPTAISTALAGKEDAAVDEAVTFTKGSMISSVVRGEIRFDGRYVIGSIQPRVTGGISALTETIIGTLSKSAKYGNATTTAAITTQGNSLFAWVDGNNVKIYSKNAIAHNEEIGISFNFLAL